MSLRSLHADGLPSFVAMMGSNPYRARPGPAAESTQAAADHQGPGAVPGPHQTVPIVPRRLLHQQLVGPAAIPRHARFAGRRIGVELLEPSGWIARHERCMRETGGVLLRVAIVPVRVAYHQATV